MHIVITGASSGIGAALALELSRVPGARLTIVARRRALLTELADRLSCPCFIVEHDLSDPGRADAWLEAAEREYGPVDVLVNNAGIQVIGPSDTIDCALGETSVQLNLLTPLRLIRAVLPAMRRRRAGVIVNMASMAALAPTPFMTYYNASKAGLAGASEALRAELGRDGVRVVTVYPGIIETDMADAALSRYDSSLALRLQPRGDAKGLAKAVRRAIINKHDRVIYPRIYGLARLFPAIVQWFVDTFTPSMRKLEAGR